MNKFPVFFLILFFACTVVFTGCQKTEITEEERFTLRIGDTYPDRNSGMGAVIERINGEFMEAYPNVDIEAESAWDQLWLDRVLSYTVGGNLPDVFRWWPHPVMMNLLTAGGHLAALNKSDFSGFGFLPGALESNEINGVFYGIPVSADMPVLFINKTLFERAGVPIPETWEDIIASVPGFRALGITPVVVNGLEGWPLSIFFDAIVQRINGDFNRNYSAITRSGEVRFTDPDFVQAARYIQSLVRAGVFNSNLTISDFGDAHNQFVRGKAAMYMAASWELGMTVNPGFFQAFGYNYDVIKFPAIRGGSGTVNDAMIWFTGNFVAAANSSVPDIAGEYMRFLAERIGPYSAVVHSEVSRKLLRFFAEAAAVSGKVPGIDYAAGDFMDEHQELMRRLCAGTITPEVFAQRLDAAAESSAVQ